MRRDTSPVSSEELETLFSSFLGHEHILLAVSGGRDSMALLILAHEWCRSQPNHQRPDLRVTTIDHGLRVAAKSETAMVAKMCATLGVSCTIHQIGSSPPASGIQAWARDRRYEALVGEASRSGCSAIATGHQAEDQAETVLMRLARGSGLDGLAAMATSGKRGRIALLRPLLGLPRSRLATTLKQRKIPWVEDPSNDNPEFERTAYAKHRNVLEDLGLSPAALGLSARRLGDARDAVDWAVAGFLATVPENETALGTAVYGHLPRQRFDALPVEIRRRTMARVMHQVSGQLSQPRLDRLEALIGRVSGPSAETRLESQTETLAGCLIKVSASYINVFREPGRNGFPVLQLHKGQSRLWDNRFMVSVPVSIRGPIDVRAVSDLPKRTKDHLLEAGCVQLPSAARAAIPAFCQGDHVLAVPQIGYASGRFGISVTAGAPPSACQNSGAAIQPGNNCDTVFVAHPRVAG